MRWHEYRQGWMAAAAFALITACSAGTGDSDTADTGSATAPRDVGNTAADGASQANRQAGGGVGFSSDTAVEGAAGITGYGFVIIRSTGPSAATLTTGRRFGGDDVVTLVAGDRVVVTDGRDTRTLSGPGRFDLGTRVPATGNVLDTARDLAQASVEGRGRSEVGGTRRTAAPLGSGGPRQPPSLSQATTVQGPLLPTGSITPHPRGDTPRADAPRIVRPRTDLVAPRADSNSLTVAPPAPDAPATAPAQPPAVAVRRAPPPPQQP